MARADGTSVQEAGSQSADGVVQPLLGLRGESGALSLESKMHSRVSVIEPLLRLGCEDKLLGISSFVERNVG